MLGRAVWGCVVVSLAVVASGCGESAPYNMAPAKGKVTFTDGTIPQGEICQITFEPDGIPASGGFMPSPASGEINLTTGAFELMTKRPGDGAPVGKHKVRILVRSKYENGTLTIPEKYTDTKTSGLTAEVPAGGKTDFEFKIDKK